MAFIVATEIGLQQVLHELKPLPRRRKIWKVTHGHDSFYLGRFGAFQAVVLSSSMGTEGATGATLSVESTIRVWDTKAIILLGIAFGANRRK